MRFLFLILILSIGFPAGDLIAANQDTSRVYKINIKQEIGPASWRHLQIGFDEAQKLNADLILIHMNTYGGAVDAADSMRTRILNSEIPVWVFIDNNAASAGALISIACDRVYMRPGGNIGAATVVNQSGEVVPDKYQSFMRSMMRSTAESHGKDTLINGLDTTFRWKRDPAIAEAMVDPSIYIEGIIDTGKVLTFTTREAILNHYCEGEAENIEELMKLAQIENYTIQEYAPDGVDKVIDFFISPIIAGILIMIIVGGIYFELQTPGIGFPSAAAVVAAILYFIPLYLEGLAANWEILLFVAGVILVIVEIFAIPGFGVAGFSGIGLIVAGLTLSMVEAFDFSDSSLDLLPLIEALFLVIFSFFLSIIGSLILTKRLLTSGNSPLQPFVLHADQKVKSGYIGVDTHYAQMVGKQGVAHTVLRPSGKVIIENEVFDAVSELGFIEKSSPIKVTRFEHGQLYVNNI
jgi:membrane-bound serine protease (ClpP class)